MTGSNTLASIEEEVAVRAYLSGSREGGPLMLATRLGDLGRRAAAAADRGGLDAELHRERSLAFAMAAQALADMYSPAPVVKAVAKRKAAAGSKW